MNILLWIIFGGAAGWIASLLVTGSGLGLVGNVLIGIAGAFVGGYLGDRLGVGAGKPGTDRPTSLAGFVWAVIGAALLLLILNLLL